MESYTSKVLPERGPMVDYEYWQDCETGLTMLVEQLKMPVVKRIFVLLEQISSPIASSFHYYQTELWKQYVEARDSNKFMQTLLKYFKVIIKSLIIVYFHLSNTLDFFEMFGETLQTFESITQFCSKHSPITHCTIIINILNKRENIIFFLENNTEILSACVSLIWRKIK